MAARQRPEEEGFLPEGELQELEVQEKMRQLRVVDEARSRLANEKAGEVEIPAPESLSRFLRRKLPQERFLIDGLWPAGGNVMFSAQRKAGKTVTVHNMARSLVDGDSFMDYFDVLDTRRVVLLDFEMSDRMLQHWLRVQGIRNRRDLMVISMRGRAGSFRITDDKVRSRWARVIEDTGAGALILDPLRPILDAIGLSEWNEGGPFLQAFDALKAEAGVTEGMIAHHHGHVAERAAGDSRFEGWPDALWSITRQDVTDPNSFRYFDAFGRDVSVDKGLVLMDDGYRLEFKTDTSEAEQSTVWDRLVTWLGEQKVKDVSEGTDDDDHEPGERKTSQIERAGIRGISKSTVADVMRTAVKAERVVVRSGSNNSKWYSVA